MCTDRRGRKGPNVSPWDALYMYKAVYRPPSGVANGQEGLGRRETGRLINNIISCSSSSRSIIRNFPVSSKGIAICPIVGTFWYIRSSYLPPAALHTDPSITYRLYKQANRGPGNGFNFPSVSRALSTICYRVIYSKINIYTCVCVLFSTDFVCRGLLNSVVRRILAVGEMIRFFE